MAFPYVFGHVGEHAGPIIILGGSGDSLRNAEMAGGQIVVDAVQNLGSSVSRHALLPLLIGGGFLEVRRMQHVSVQAPPPDVVVGVFLRIISDPLDLSVVPRTMWTAHREDHCRWESASATRLSPSVPDVELILL